MDDNKKVELSEESEQRIAKAVSKELKKFSFKSIGLKDIVLIIIVIAVAIFAYNFNQKLNNNLEGLKTLVSFDSGADERDLVLEDKGVLGYLAADFEEAILGEASQKREVIVYTQEVSDTASLVQTGIFNWSALSKTQAIIYKGSVDYYVDLTNFSKDNISYNEEENTVTMLIPHASRKDININENDITFSDPEKGLLAWGEVEATPEQMSNVQADARKKMEDKLETDKVSDIADRFAKLTIWEIYSPIVKSVGKDVSLVVEFED